MDETRKKRKDVQAESLEEFVKQVEYLYVVSCFSASFKPSTTDAKG